MSARNWLPTVLRARQAQEDLVAQRVALARRDAGLALQPARPSRPLGWPR